MSSITISFDAPTPNPVGGYIVNYRKVGDSSYTKLTPNPLTSPVTIPGINPTFAYEGTIQCNCSNSIYSSPITFNTTPCIGNDKKVINGVCQSGYRQNISSVTDGMGGYICTYNYLFIDGTNTANFTETTTTPCIIAS